jgi:uncharacterized protein YcfL
MRTKEILSTSLWLLSLLLVSSCSHEESTDMLESHTKIVGPTAITSRVISKSDIPKSAKVLVVNNKEEEELLIRKMSKDSVRFVVTVEAKKAKKNKK